LGDFEYLGEVKLGSSSPVKPKKDSKGSAQAITIVVISLLVAGGIASYEIGFKFGKLSNASQHMGVTSSESSAIVPSSSLGIDRGNYQVAYTNGAKSVSKTTKTGKKNQSSGPTPAGSPSASDTSFVISDNSSNASGGHATPTPTFSMNPVFHPSPTATPPRIRH
jgi:hypothetical protein